jgi:hypothetical protein
MKIYKSPNKTLSLEITFCEMHFVTKISWYFLCLRKKNSASYRVHIGDVLLSLYCAILKKSSVSPMMERSLGQNKILPFSILLRKVLYVKNLMSTFVSFNINPSYEYYKIGFTVHYFYSKIKFYKNTVFAHFTNFSCENTPFIRRMRLLNWLNIESLQDTFYI